MSANKREIKPRFFLEFLLPLLGVSLLAVLYFPRARHLALEFLLWFLALLGLGLVGGTVLYIRHMKRLERQSVPSVPPAGKSPTSCPVCGAGLMENSADPKAIGDFVLLGCRNQPRCQYSVRIGRN
jgi:hypothetical protein